MADITMCDGYKCPKKQECYRYRAIPCQLNSYANFESVCSDGKYQYFVPINGRKVRDDDEKNG